MKKILIVNDGFPPHSWGGAATIAGNHAKGMRKLGWEVQTHVPSTRRAFKDALAFMPDIVHFHNIHHGWHYPLISLAKKSGAKTFLTAHDVMSFAYEKVDVPRKIGWVENFFSAKRRFRPFGNVLTRYYLRKLNKVIAVSHALKKALELNGIHNVDVVHNGIDVDHFKTTDKVGVEGKKVILFVGRFTPPKGSEVMLKAMREVVCVVSDACLLVVGTTTNNWLKASIAELGLEDSVRFVAAVSYAEIPKYYAGADVVVVPSICLDCFPTANLEAMAAGRPVVATCFGGSHEAVTDNVTGFIVNPLDVKILAQKIIHLLQNPHEAKAMGERGYSRALEHFTARNMLDAYCAYY